MTRGWPRREGSTRISPRLGSRRRREQILHGRASERGQIVRAGPLVAVLTGAEISRVRVGRTPLVDRVRVVVRDQRWNVIPSEVRVVERHVGDDSFVVHLEVRNASGPIEFAWRGEIVGGPDSTLRYGFTGRVERPCECTRLGLAIIHPVASHAARRFRTIGTDGVEREQVFPLAVGPQVIRDGALRGLCPPYQSLAVDLDGGAVLELAFEGDEFEMEDERNWTEYGFKSYSGPFARGWPLYLDPETPVEQSVSISYMGTQANDGNEDAGVRLNPLVTRRVPEIGFGVASHHDALSIRERNLLASLRPAYVLSDLHPARAGWQEELSSAVQTGRALDCPVAAALHLTSEWRSELDALAAAHTTKDTPLAMVSLFSQIDDDEDDSYNSGTPPEIAQYGVAALRAKIGGLPIAVGSDRCLAEVIRTPPSIGSADAISFSASPSGHADEDWAILTNLSALGDAVRTLHAYLPDVPVIVSPITLQIRSGGGPRPPGGQGSLPTQVDVRQMSLLGAGWTLGSLAQLCTADAWRATYYETTGWRGVIECDRGSPNPAFPSRPGDVFPMYYVFRDVADLRIHRPIGVQPRGPVCALAFERADGCSVLLANLSPTRRRVSIGPLPGSAVGVRVLNSVTAEQAMREPNARIAHPMDLVGSTLSMVLRPYAYVRIDPAEATRA